ncbi:hypothetical protein M440DRAFT_1370927 [Trichoderma longibrachiatum ATCC 18648]|uniref:Uncharacterized protein n=1 Tax=Trichoderma longibrachiatum ATCC 18648 TaxID=983965 RepID=A0A2T4CCE0_TRILO|nr:hypothetical protein M440DRAFT_1370927 [Trichoderma longibrachiatum ATCC 18648]
MPFSASTWNSLGLSVAATFAVLGSSALFDMKRTAELFSLQPPPRKRELRSEEAEDDGSGLCRVVAILVGSRDLTMATALIALHRAGMRDAMGTVILSSMGICVADLYIVWRAGKKVETTLFAMGAAVWAVIGLGLKEYLD